MRSIDALVLLSGTAEDGLADGIFRLASTLGSRRGQVGSFAGGETRILNAWFVFVCDGAGVHRAGSGEESPSVWRGKAGRQLLGRGARFSETFSSAVQVSAGDDGRPTTITRGRVEAVALWRPFRTVGEGVVVLSDHLADATARTMLSKIRDIEQRG